MTTVRLTVGQAVVRFLAEQYSERDGARHRLIEACFGIFGHGAGQHPGRPGHLREGQGAPATLLVMGASTAARSADPVHARLDLNAC
jgi:3D-(3,5/4)-trihydroxycyclohexane-1,2-dione acylhydrolase (decyclizing)